MSHSRNKNQRTTADLFEAKKKRRREIAAKSVEEKFEILIESLLLRYDFVVI